VTRLDQLAMRVRALEARLATLEGRSRGRKRAAAPRPSDSVIAERERLWAKYVMLEMQHGHGRVRLTKLSFAARHGLNPSELGRWLSPSDRRGIPAGSKPDRSHRRALNAAIAELEARGKNQTDNVSLISHGKMAHSQLSAARLQ
jgi:BMFP domain-containing protein YqiC